MSPRVLVVDDEPLVALNLQAFLEDEGMQVDFVTSAEAAIELLKGQTRFHVCVMDLRLPGMDGNAAIRALSRLRPELRFIVHTGSIHYGIPEDLRTLGISETQLFHKPVRDMTALAAEVRRLTAD